MMNGNIQYHQAADKSSTISWGRSHIYWAHSIPWIFKCAMNPAITMYGQSAPRGKPTIETAMRKHACLIPSLLMSTISNKHNTKVNQAMSTSSKHAPSHVRAAAALATGARTAYEPKANAAMRLRAEPLRKKMDITKAAMRVLMSTVLTPAYMRLIVAMVEQKSARLLATRNASKE